MTPTPLCIASMHPAAHAVAPLEAEFPGVTGPNGAIDRAKLRHRVLDNPAAMKRLEEIVHPIVGGQQIAFLQKAMAEGHGIVVLDIPLLFETGGDKRADAILVVSAPADVQRARVLARGQMTEAEFEAILARQVPDSMKRSRADFIIDTSQGFAAAEARVDEILAELRLRLANTRCRNGQWGRLMREVVFDTETTGLNPGQGDRIVEVGCIELINLLPTGNEFQIIHHWPPGLRGDRAHHRHHRRDAARQTPFRTPECCRCPARILWDSPIVAHNAEFDRGFLNDELELMGRPPFPKERFIDTLVLAREHRPGSPASLDAVCKRFDISIKDRVLHGALLDAQLLAMAYLELRGGRERRLDLADNNGIGGQGQVVFTPRRQRPTPLPSRLTDAEAAAHAAFLETLGDKDHEVIWKKLG